MKLLSKTELKTGDIIYLDDSGKVVPLRYSLVDRFVRWLGCTFHLRKFARHKERPPIGIVTEDIGRDELVSVLVQGCTKLPARSIPVLPKSSYTLGFVLSSKGNDYSISLVRDSKTGNIVIEGPRELNNRLGSLPNNLAE